MSFCHCAKMNLCAKKTNRVILSLCHFDTHPIRDITTPTAERGVLLGRWFASRPYRVTGRAQLNTLHEEQ